MNWLQELLSDKDIVTHLSAFLKRYGKSGLLQALQTYTNIQQTYICKTKNTLSKINIDDIFHLEINKHTITIHTDSNVHQKYGSLNHELKYLPHAEFVKCNKSCIVSIRKIKSIYDNDIILTDNTKIHMSRTYAPQVIIAFSHFFGTEPRN